VTSPQQDLEASPRDNDSGLRAAVQAALPTICISGKLPSGSKKSDYEQPLMLAGYRLVDEVVPGLAFLVVAEPDSNSSKAQKARKHGVPIISEDELRALTQSNASAAPDPVTVDTSQPQETESMASAAGSDQGVRRFEYVDEGSSKFWEIKVEGESTTVRYGRLGASGQTQVKAHGDAASAVKAADKLIAEKVKGGYKEVGAQVAAAAKAVEPPKSKPAPAVKVPDAPVKAAKPVKQETPAAASKASKPVAAVSGGTLCISGKLPSGRKKSDYEQPLRAIGIELVDDVIKGLGYLVLADPASTSSKATKARGMGVKIMSEEELIAMAGMTAE